MWGGLGGKITKPAKKHEMMDMYITVTVVDSFQLYIYIYQTIKFLYFNHIQSIIHQFYLNKATEISESLTFK